ncbi:MAG: hypothetical protein L0Z50_20925 [Verrucomicrobiales bacterium]|nr:hypothetical protein [Verrucomicrobiales bacterium]
MNESTHFNEGMSLRDWFAGQALIGALNLMVLHSIDVRHRAESMGLRENGLQEHELIARMAYEQAAAMLRAREAQP